DDTAVLEPDVGLDDAPVIDDQRVGDDGVDGALGARHLALAHAVADDLAAAEPHFLAIGREVLLDLDDEVGVGEADAVADRRAVHVGVGRTGNRCWHQSCPVTRPLKPKMRRAPPIGTSRTSRAWPGSNRIAVPAAMSRRMPRAASRSKSSASLVS